MCDACAFFRKNRMVSVRAEGSQILFSGFVLSARWGKAMIHSSQLRKLILLFLRFQIMLLEKLVEGAGWTLKARVVDPSRRANPPYEKKQDENQDRKSVV